MFTSDITVEQLYLTVPTLIPDFSITENDLKTLIIFWLCKNKLAEYDKLDFIDFQLNDKISKTLQLLIREGVINKNADDMISLH